MSWHFSQALVAAFSAGKSSAGELSAPSSMKNMPQVYSSSDKMTAFCLRSRYGMTCEPLTANLGEELLTWFRGAFPAKTSVPQEREPDWMASAPACGEKWRESLVRYDLGSSSWKIHLSLFPEDLQWSSVTLPKWGMTRSGAVYQHPTRERPISGIGFGSLLPTPSASQCETRPSKKWNPKSQSGRSLGCMAATGMWPTPRACDGKGSTRPESAAKVMARGYTPNLQERVAEAQAGGHLNPTWVEKLMGWPDDWTSLNPISHVSMCFWFMGFCDGEETGRNQVLRVLRRGYAAQEIQGAIGRPVSVHEAAILLAELCEHANRPYEARVFLACAEALEEEMRGVPDREIASGTPYRSGQHQQRTGEHPDALQALSRFLAHHGPAYWKNGSWEDAVPRVADGVAARVDRLKAIGNGQVPRVAAAAFSILLGRLRDSCI